MKVNVCTSTGAHLLLDELERAGRQLADIYSRTEVLYRGTSTKFGQLNFSGGVEGSLAGTILGQDRDNILVAPLDIDFLLEISDPKVP
ncbi:MAG TPA: hypothetical protein VEI58_10985 [Chthoniobacterales bacterium]|nr:hypothetical protein [Chthoniobacterales bacterium]